MTGPGYETCLMCGLPLPERPRPWWARLIGLNPPPPTHTADDPPEVLDACWRAFSVRMGTDPDRPRPEPRR